MTLYFRGHPKIRRLDMLHSPDYANMEYQQMLRRLEESRNNDEEIARGLQYVTYVFCYFLKCVGNCLITEDIIHLQ